LSLRLHREGNRPNSGTNGQFDYLSHAFLCTEGATLAISSSESDEDPIFVTISSGGARNDPAFGVWPTSVLQTLFTAVATISALIRCIRSSSVTGVHPPDAFKWCCSNKFQYRSSTAASRTLKFAVP
jgi:hypothetical protein